MPAITSSLFPVANIMSRIIERAAELFIAITETTDPWNPNYQSSISVTKSTDGGQSWGNEVVTANGTASGYVFDETNMVLLSNNNILQAIRSNNNQPYFFLSTYNGTSWSLATDGYYRLPGTGTAMLLTHSSDSVIAQVRRYDRSGSDSLQYSLLYWANPTGSVWDLIGRADNVSRLARDGGLVEFDDTGIGVAVWADNRGAVNGYFKRFRLVPVDALIIKGGIQNWR